jgi:DNA (cytosine-5)-methyltransferase 1
MALFGILQPLDAAGLRAEILRVQTFGSIFAGIGGFDLGLERAGWKCSWQVESDPDCNKVLKALFPGAKRYLDAKTIDWTSLERVGLICGGFPCQPFSQAARGRRLGTADDRWLWPVMLRAIEGLKPDAVVVENVAHIDGPALKAVVSDMEARAYEVSILEVPACAFGHDHRRTRLWILGHTNGHGESGFPFDAEAPGLPKGRR